MNVFRESAKLPEIKPFNFKKAKKKKKLQKESRKKNRRKK